MTITDKPIALSNISISSPFNRSQPKTMINTIPVKIALRPSFAEDVCLLKAAIIPDSGLEKIIATDIKMPEIIAGNDTDVSCMIL